MKKTTDTAAPLNPPAGTIPAERRRQGADRRRITLRMFMQGGLTPRRRNGRRAGEQVLVDWHEPHLLGLALTIVLLNVIDAFLTVTLITTGAREVNPFLAFVMNDYPQLFAVVKMTLTGGGVVVLVALARAKVFRFIRVGTLLHSFLLGYGVLIAYEWWLLHSIL